MNNNFNKGTQGQDNDNEIPGESNTNKMHALLIDFRLWSLDSIKGFSRLLKRRSSFSGNPIIKFNL